MKISWKAKKNCDSVLHICVESIAGKAYYKWVLNLVHLSLKSWDLRTRENLSERQVFESSDVLWQKFMLLSCALKSICYLRTVIVSWQCLQKCFSSLLWFLATPQLPSYLDIRLSRHWNHYFGFSPIKQLWSAGFHISKIFLVSWLFWFSTFSIPAQDLKQPLTSSFRRGLVLLRRL